VTRRIDVGAVSLSVTELGDGPPILFLHGFPDGGGAWSKVAGPLSGQFRCILPDQRGYGLSDQPRSVENYATDLLIADIDALADALGLGAFALAGHDWGGLLAWWYAARRHARVSHLIIANAPHPVLLQKALIEDPDQRAASQYITRLRTPGSEDRVAGATSGMINWYRAAPFMVPAPEDLATPPDWIIAEDFKITMPTLVLWGLQDTALLPVLLEGLASYAPDLTLKRFAHAGHDIIHEIPDEIAADIGAFLA
jgi:pimeloyl-ACP methyl ester carboxylesterase